MFFILIFLTLLTVYRVNNESLKNDTVNILAFDLSTNSKFTEQGIVKTKQIPFKTQYEDDPNMFLGEQKVRQEGEEGKEENNYKIIYYDGALYSQDLVGRRIVDPKPKIIAKGTKPVYKTINGEGGQFESYGSLRVWATSYDKTCLGCDEWTATGKHLAKGIIAVDPTVIPLHTKLYVPGYGVGFAEDVGGGIKGNKIDLGFEDLRTGNWSARWVDIYLIQ